MSQERSLVALTQFTATSDPERNFGVIRDLVEQAKACRAEMVFVPEAFDYIGESGRESLALSESIDGPRMTKYTQLARDNQIWLSLGGFHEKVSGKELMYNTHVVVDCNGSIISKYSKAHLFDVDIKGKVSLKESDYFMPGSAIVPPVETPVGKIGLGICYDVRFPELSLSLAKQGAEILTYPSAFTVATGLAHWEVLLRARAIETQCYVIAAAQTGKHNEKRQSYGHSMVVDPWGCVIAQCREGTGICLALIDRAYIKQVKSQMPVSDHRRNDLYTEVKAI